MNSLISNLNHTGGGSAYGYSCRPTRGPKVIIVDIVGPKQ